MWWSKIYTQIKLMTNDIPFLSWFDDICSMYHAWRMIFYAYYFEMTHKTISHTGWQQLLQLFLRQEFSSIQISNSSAKSDQIDFLLDWIGIRLARVFWKCYLQKIWTIDLLLYAKWNCLLAAIIICVILMYVNVAIWTVSRNRNTKTILGRENLNCQLNRLH